MELWVNGQMRMRWIVENTDEYAPYTWKGYWDGTSTINVVFVNHDSSPDVADLMVDFVKVNNVTVQTESTNAVFCAGDDFETPSGGVPATETVTQTGSVCYTVTGTTPLARLFEYDYNNMVTSINENGTVSTYTYNPAGQRVKKVEDGTATYYFYANYQVERTASTEAQVVYYYINGEQIAQRTITETSEQLLYVHKDHLGSAVRLTDETGAVVQSIAYEPYGTTVYSHGNNEPDRQFTGQIKDGTGLYYYNARYYNPTLGRFITADTVLDGLNRYTYCGNNPVRYTDPTGHGSRETKNDRPSDSGGTESNSKFNKSDLEAKGVERPDSNPKEPTKPGDSTGFAKVWEERLDKGPKGRRGPPEAGSNNGGNRRGMWLVDAGVRNPLNSEPHQDDYTDLLLRDAPQYMRDGAGNTLNTIRNFGCTYISLVIYINQLIRSTPGYNAGVIREITPTMYNLQKYFYVNPEGNGRGGFNVDITLAGIERMVFDATGITVRASKLEGQAARNFISLYFQAVPTRNRNQNMGIIANVGGHPDIVQHWVYTFGLKDNNGLKYHETFSPWAQKTYLLEHVVAIFVIQVVK